jgi:hypothetical protein
VDRASLMTAERVGDLIGDHAWREISLCLVDALEADIPELAERPGFWRGNRRIAVRLRRREAHTRRGREWSRGQLRGLGRWLEAAVA